MRSSCSVTVSGAASSNVVEPPLPPALGQGLERLYVLAERAGITLVE
jgi:hypothetical protein